MLFSIGIIIIVAFISGYFFILRHLRKEKENTEREINKIGKIE
jgi:preprotein translocase subunit YajC